MPSKSISPKIWTARTSSSEAGGRRYWHALRLLTSRDLKVRYSTTALGYVWSIIDPLLMAAIYYVVFTFVFQRGDTAAETPYIVFLLAAILPWTWFNGNVSDATRAFRTEAKLIRSTRIPRTIWVFRQILSKGIEFVASLPILIVAIIITGADVNALVLLFPLAFALQLVLTAGVNLIVAPLAVFARDLERVVKLGLRVLFYASPILYSPRVFAEEPVLHALYGLNPLTGLFELYRAGLFSTDVDWTYVLSSAVVSLVLVGVGALVFRRSIRRVLKEI